jgi:hypothetical protein
MRAGLAIDLGVGTGRFWEIKCIAVIKDELRIRWN